MQCPFSQPAMVHVQILNRLLDIIDFSRSAVIAGYFTIISHLSALLSIKWSAVKDDLYCCRPGCFLHCPPLIIDNGKHPPAARILFISCKFDRGFKRLLYIVIHT